jgi:hypothetical protein
MCRLTQKEAKSLQPSRSQIVTLKRGQNIKYLPYAFTEYGALMAANILNSPRAVQMSIFVVRAFARKSPRLHSRAEYLTFQATKAPQDKLTALPDRRLIRSFSAFSLAKEDQVNDNA